MEFWLPWQHIIWYRISWRSHNSLVYGTGGDFMIGKIYFFQHLRYDQFTRIFPPTQVQLSIKLCPIILRITNYLHRLMSKYEWNRENQILYVSSWSAEFSRQYNHDPDRYRSLLKWLSLLLNISGLSLGGDADLFTFKGEVLLSRRKRWCTFCICLTCRTWATFP